MTTFFTSTSTITFSALPSSAGPTLLPRLDTELGKVSLDDEMMVTGTPRGSSVLGAGEETGGTALQLSA